MDLEVLTQLLTVTGPMGALAYAMFRHHSETQRAQQERLVELIGEWKGQSALLMKVVQDNSAAVTALIAKLERE